MENNNKLDNEKQDAIDRKIDGIVKIFGLAQRDFRSEERRVGKEC